MESLTQIISASADNGTLMPVNYKFKLNKDVSNSWQYHDSK